MKNYDVNKNGLVEKEVNDLEFDYDNPPVSSDLVPDSCVPAEAILKLMEARKFLVEAIDYVQHKDNEKVLRQAEKLAKSSPYAQVQFLVFLSDLEEALVKVNTLLHTHDPNSLASNVRKVVDETSAEMGITPKQFAFMFARNHAIAKMVKDLED